MHEHAILRALPVSELSRYALEERARVLEFLAAEALRARQEAHAEARAAREALQVERAAHQAQVGALRKLLTAPESAPWPQSLRDLEEALRRGAQKARMQGDTEESAAYENAAQRLQAPRRTHSTENKG